MNRLKSTLTILAAATLVSAAPLPAQQGPPPPHPRLSPHQTVSADLGEENRVTVVYGRPFTKSPKDGTVRKIWGGLVPFGKVWRTGADEATLLIAQSAVMIGTNTIPAGVYTLFMLPQADGSAQLIVSKQFGQWGETYDEKHDLTRIDMKKGTPEKPVDQFTITITKGAAGSGELTMYWEDISYTVPLSVKK